MVMIEFILCMYIYVPKWQCIIWWLVLNDMPAQQRACFYFSAMFMLPGSGPDVSVFALATLY